MKKIYALIGILFLFTHLQIQAQCTPNVSLTVPGLYPDTLVAGCVGQAYDQTIQLVFAKDTSVTLPIVGPLTVQFASYKILSISNLPAGINYQCNNGTCDWSINQSQVNRGCVKVSGMPTAVNTGNDTIIVSIEATFVGGTPPPVTIPFPSRLTIKAAGQCITSIQNPSASSPSVNIYPNPGMESLKLSFSPNQIGEEVVIRDINGKEIWKSQNVSGEIEIPTTNWVNGMYVISVVNGNSYQSYRWIRQ